MDEQEKKYQDLFTELTNYERSGVRMQMNGFPASPLQIVSAHMVREESNYMRDYILDVLIVVYANCDMYSPIYMGS